MKLKSFHFLTHHGRWTNVQQVLVEQLLISFAARFLAREVDGEGITFFDQNEENG